MSIENNTNRAPQLGGKHKNHITGQEPELSGERARISPLIVHVDDVEIMRIVVSESLIDFAGYRVESFEWGRDALRFCQETPPALLITDIYRPGMGGYELCGLIRNDENLRDLPIIINSVDIGECQFLQQETLNAYILLKPFSFSELIGMVNQIVTKQGLALPDRAKSW